MGGLNAATSIFGFTAGKGANNAVEDPAGQEEAASAGQAAAAFGMGLKKKTGIDPNDPNYIMQNMNLMKGRPFSFK